MGDFAAIVAAHTPAGVFAVRVQDDAMAPTLREGDWVLIDTADRELTREGIYAFRAAEEELVRRIARTAQRGVVHILSDNHRYPPQEARKSDLTTIGRAVAFVTRAP